MAAFSLLARFSGGSEAAFSLRIADAALLQALPLMLPR